MKLSTKGRYGLRAMIDIAINGKDGQISIKNIAERQNISESYLEQIIAVLKKKGFVKSCRGAQGGYHLNIEPKNISVGDILRALEGNLDPVECSVINDAILCEDSELCVTKYVWKKISDSINQVVDNITLEDLVLEQERIDIEAQKSITHF